MKLISSAQVLLPGQFVFSFILALLLYPEMQQSLTFILFSHNVSSHISICHSTENPEVLKAGCVPSF
jgi:hypothetical protein